MHMSRLPSHANMAALCLVEVCHIVYPLVIHVAATLDQDEPDSHRHAQLISARVPS